MDLEINVSGNGIEDIDTDLQEIDEDGIKKPLPVSLEQSDRIKKKAKRVSSSKHGGNGSRDALNGISNFVAPHRRWKNSRRSRNGHGRGLPKKGGAGGKGVWGILGSEILEEEIEDPEDPNYDSEVNDQNIELKEIIPEMTPEEFTTKAGPIILEYFQSGDTHEVAKCFDEFLTGVIRPLVTVNIVEIAMEHKQSHREMASVLISDLYGKVITSKDISSGLSFKFLFFLNKF